MSMRNGLLECLDLQPLIAPRSIAVVGASERSALGRWMLEGLAVLRFEGAVYPVNPKFGELLGHKAYASIADLPEAPDLAALCIGRAGVLDAIAQCAARGVRAAVIYDSGFSETGGEGRALQDRVVAMCREAGIALCGPNCMGILNPSARSTSFKQTIRTAQGLAGNVALVSQSGSIAGTLLADLRRFGFSAVVSSGNEAVVDLAQYIDYFAGDPATKVIAAFIESVRNPERFVAALDRAAHAGKPVVILKVGKSERTQHAITSHTGGLAGESRVFSEVLRAHRAIEVSDLDEMTEVLAACQSARWPDGRSINVLTTSGGQAELILDVATASGLELAPLATEARARIETEVGPITGDGNPLDAWGNGDAKRNMPISLQALDGNVATDVIVFCSSDSVDDQPLGRAGRELDYARILVEAAQKSEKPHYLMSMRPGVMHTGQVRYLADAGIAVVGGARQGLGAIQRVMDWRRAPTPAAAEAAGTVLPPGRTINEHDAKRILAAYGLPTPRERLCADLASASRAALEIGYPVVLKIAADDVPHKSEYGLVAVGLRDGDALATALARMTDVARRIGAPVDSWLVQEFVAEGVEVFAGVSRDPDFGLALAFGMGGVGIEVLKDFAMRMLPLRAGEAGDMIAAVRGAAMLGAYRNKPAADVESLVACIEQLAAFAWANRDQIKEIDLNPVKVREAGRGCVVVDALIVTRAAD
ncbi:MAG: pauA [Hyphomicrobiales bacterium]|nr:pauA [Hyphomicrobiales bacterium]